MSLRDKYFRLKENGTNVRPELLAGRRHRADPAIHVSIAEGAALGFISWASYLRISEAADREGA